MTTPACPRKYMDMGVESYVVRGVTYWMIDETITMPDGREKRLRKRRIPSEKHAELLVAKARADAFEGKYFDRVKPCTLNVKDVWELYEPISKRDNDTHNTDKSRATHLLASSRRSSSRQPDNADVDCRISGGTIASKQNHETERKPQPPPHWIARSSCCKRAILNYAAKCGEGAVQSDLDVAACADQVDVRSSHHHGGTVPPLDLRKLEVAEEGHAVCGEGQAGVPGNRHGRLRHGRAQDGDPEPQALAVEPARRLHRASGPGHQDGGGAPGVYLTRRDAIDAIKAMPRDIRSDHVFINPKTGEAYRDIRKLWVKYRAEAGIAAGDAWVPRLLTRVHHQLTQDGHRRTHHHGADGAQDALGLRPLQHRRRLRPA